jgi:hypothetical protein
MVMLSIVEQIAIMPTVTAPLGQFKMFKFSKTLTGGEDAGIS